MTINSVQILTAKLFAFSINQVTVLLCLGSWYCETAIFSSLRLISQLHLSVLIYLVRDIPEGTGKKTTSTVLYLTPSSYLILFAWLLILFQMYGCISVLKQLIIHQRPKNLVLFIGLIDNRNVFVPENGSRYLLGGMARIFWRDGGMRH